MKSVPVKLNKSFNEEVNLELLVDEPKERNLWKKRLPSLSTNRMMISIFCLTWNDYNGKILVQPVTWVRSKHC